MIKSRASNITLFLLMLVLSALCISFGSRPTEACFVENEQTTEDQVQNSTPKEEEVVIVEEPEIDYNLVFKEDDSENLTELKTLIDECEKNKEEAHDMAQCARNLGYEEESDIVTQAKMCWVRNNELKEIYENRLESIKYELSLQEFPVATYIWKYLHDYGYNDYVCAGILGNMMCECAGKSLDLHPDSVSSYGFYGICQWSKSYSSVWYTDLYFQCDFLVDTIQYELDTFGYAYRSGFNYEAFTQLTNEQDAALAFAKCYERCDKCSYTARQSAATIAYNYFVV